MLIFGGPLLIALALLLAGFALGMWLGAWYYGFNVWLVALTVVLWGIMSPLVFWSADTAWTARPRPRPATA